MPDVKTQVIRGMKWSLYAKLIAQIFSWVVTFVVIRILVPEDYGIIEIATAMISLGIALGVSGFSDVIVQKKTHDKQLCAQVLTIAVVFNTSLFLFLFFSASAIAQWYKTPELTLVIQALSINILLVSLTIVPAGILKREMNFKTLSICQLIQAMTNSTVTLTLALLEYAYWSIALGSLAGTIMFALLLNLITKAPIRLTLIFTGFKNYFHFGLFTIINRVLNFIFQKADSLIIGKILGISPLGIYSVGSELANLPLEKVAQSLNEVSYAGYAKIKDDPQAIAYYYLQSSRLLSLLVFPVFWGMASIAEPLIQLLLGDKWLGSTVVFQILALIMPFRIYQLATHSAIAGIGHPKFNTKNLIALCLIIPCAVIVGLNWGLTGAASGWASGYFIFFIWMMNRSLCFLVIRQFDYIKSISVPMFAGILMLLINWLLNPYFVDYNVVIKISTLVFSGATVYLTTIILLDRNRLIQIKALILK